jgi:hypothetical protein
LDYCKIMAITRHTHPVQSHLYLVSDNLLYTWITLSPTSLLTMLDQHSFTKCSILFQNSYEKKHTEVFHKTSYSTSPHTCYHEQHHFDVPFIFMWISRLIQVEMYVLVITSILNLYLQISYICKNSHGQ